MANPAGKTGALYPEDRNEFVEIYNNTDDTIDVSFYIFSDFDVEDEICAWEDSSILYQYNGLVISTTLIPPFTYALIFDKEYGSDSTGEYRFPYSIPAGVVILTTDDTSIGNGLTMNDSIVLYRNDLKDSVSFFFPFRTDDGYSIELIDYERGDIEDNWAQSFVLHGTPGYENTVSNYVNMSITYVEITPSLPKSNDSINCKVGIKNNSYKMVEDWEMMLFIDDSLKSSYKGIPLDKGIESSVNFTISPLKPGSYRFKFYLSIQDDDSLYDNTVENEYRIYTSGNCIGVEWIDYRLKIKFNFPFHSGKVDIRIINSDGIQFIHKKFSEPMGEIEIDLGEKFIPGRYIVIGSCQDLRSHALFYVKP